MESGFREIAFKYALKNALEFGSASPKAVMGKVLAENPEFREKARHLYPAIEEVVGEVNSMRREEIEERIKKFTFEEERKERRKGLPELKGAEEERVVMRFAPNPSGPLHLGHARAVALNDEYVRGYGGELILRFEDTDPGRVLPEAYQMIREDLEWLGATWHREVCQSSRLEFYYRYARELIEGRHAYVCTCSGEGFQKLKVEGRECPHRSKGVKENIDDFARMFSEFGEGEAVLRFKSGLALPDPAMREFPLMRISDTAHPLVRARVFPLMNFSVTVDDHLLGVSHVLRGKDHIVNTRKQEHLYRALSWEMPEFIHYGRLKIEGLPLSTSRIYEGIREGLYSGWDDIQLGTLKALRRRGFQAEAVRKSMLDGITLSDISFSWKNLYSYNRELIDSMANRYFFVAEPRVLEVFNAKSFENFPPLHPDYRNRGKRRISLKAEEGIARVLIAREDASLLNKGDFIRFMEGFNLEVVEVGGRIRGNFRGFELEEARRRRARFLHWLPEEGNVRVKVLKPGRVDKGYAEGELIKREGRGSIIQFERYGFCRIGKLSEDEATLYFTHR